MSSSDQNLLFGIIALQLDFINETQLLEAMRAWVFQKSVPIGQLLVNSGAIRDEEERLLRALVDKHLDKHGQDTHQSLASLSSIGTVRAALERLEDAEVNASLLRLSRAPRREQDDAHATLTEQVGTPTSAGTRFRILRFHDKGGLGRVYVARDEELGRDVALKEIDPSKADEPFFRSRFTVEAEVTGGLEHPGIVPVYGLGQYADGRPFYAMRFIHGDSLKDAITRFYHGEAGEKRVGDRKIAMRQLLGRFVDVCHAIEYAHSRGVLHRDLKPGNIMLGKYGETLVVDWGLAKVRGRDEPATDTVQNALRPRSASDTAPTEMGTAVGTPGYMSPEQAAGRLDLLGNATDVYGLGATLYHVLTGQSSQTGSDREMAIRRVEKGEFPPPRAINPQVPLALEAICLKAMALEPGQRYRSPRELADDVERWLADEPVSVCHDPIRVRIRRWGRKHPRLVATLAASLIVGFGGLIGISGVLSVKNGQLETAYGQLLLANAAEREAKEVADSQRNEALQAQAQTEAVAGYLVEAFRSPDPQWEGRTITVAEVLDRAVVELQSRFHDQPMVKARLWTALGETYLGLGLPEPAIDLLKSALQITESGVKASSRDILSIKTNLGEALGDASRIDESLAMLDEAVGLCRSQLGEDDPNTLAAVAAYIRFAGATCKPEDYLALCRDHLARCRQVLGDEHAQTVDAVVHLAIAYRKLGQFHEATEVITEILSDNQEDRSGNEPGTLVLWKEIAAAYAAMNDFDKAIALYEKTVAKMRNVYGPQHPLTLRTLSGLARIYDTAGRFDEAIPLYEQAYKRMVERQGSQHINTLVVQFNLGKAYFDVGRGEEGLSLMSQAVDAMIENYGYDLSTSTGMLSALAGAYTTAGRAEEAIPLLEKALAQQLAEGSEDRPAVLHTKYHLAMALASTKQMERAITMMEEVVERSQSVGDPNASEFMSMLANIYEQAGQPERAVETARKTVDTLRQTVGAAHPRTLKATSVLAAAMIRCGDAATAIPLLESTVDAQSKLHGDGHAFTQWSLATLANAYSRADRFDDAIETLKRLLKIRRVSPGPDHSYTVQSEQQLVTLYRVTGRFAEAEPLERLAVERARRAAPDSTELASALANLGSTQVELGKLVEAEPTLRECVTLRQRLIPDDWLLFNAKRVLGTVLSGQQKFAEAEPLLLEGYRGLVECAENAHPVVREKYIPETVQEIVDLYRGWNKPDKAEQWNAKLPAKDADKPAKSAG